MKTFDVKPQSFVTAIRCDKCGKECHHSEEETEFLEFVSIENHCGYGTGDDDGKHVEVDLCFACFKELLGPYWRIKRDWIAEVAAKADLFARLGHGQSDSEGGG